MKITEQNPWPPTVQGPDGGTVVPEKADIVTAAQKYEAAMDHIAIKARKNTGKEYQLVLNLPQNLHDKAIALILGKPERSVGEVWLLEVS